MKTLQERLVEKTGMSLGHIATGLNVIKSRMKNQGIESFSKLKTVFDERQGVVFFAEDIAGKQYMSLFYILIEVFEEVINEMMEDAANDPESWQDYSIK